MLVDTALARRVERVAASFHSRWVRGLAQRPDDPRRIERYDQGPVVAAASLALPDHPLLNRVVDLGDVDLDEIPPLVSWYRRRGIWPWFDVGPAEGAEAVLDALAAEGAWPVGFLQVSVGLPSEGPEAADVEIEPVDGETIGRFAATLAEGHAVADPGEVALDLASWHQIPGLFCLLARIDTTPVGAAALYADDGVGFLADSSTLLPHRGRGVSGALLDERLRLARALGCDVVAGMSRFGSSTHVELQRAGLVAGYTRAVLHLGG